MKLIDALRVLNQPTTDSDREFGLLLACGFTPLHLVTFLGAHLRQGNPTVRSTVMTGLFDDLAGTLERAAKPPAPAPDGTRLDAVAVVVEWADLDPRLDLRRLGGWDPADAEDLIARVQANVSRIEGAIAAVAARVPVVVSTPGLPLPPISHRAPGDLAPLEATLRSEVEALALRLTGRSNVRVVSPFRLDAASPPGDRLDAKGLIATGFPYRAGHASELSRHLASLLLPRAPKKGLVTDLDDTFWAGILGEVGIDGVSWDLEGGAQIHGLYQQLLAALARSGALIGVASKNDPGLVEEAFARLDTVMPASSLFPIRAGWGPKSRALAEIREAWNIGFDAIVFVDDSPLEIAEVEREHPEVECFRFPREDPARVLDLLWTLRERFGKRDVTDEDRIRSQSLRSASSFDGSGAAGQEAPDQDAFLAGTEAEVTFGWSTDRDDTRAFELINKTNQFNLNGRRLDQADWWRFLEDPDRFAVTVSYRDRFGPLGKIAVVAGSVEDEGVSIDTWVMSCRAFSRRIEHQTLRRIFERLDRDTLDLDVAATPRNGPLRDFVASIVPGWDGASRATIVRSEFVATAPPLHHTVYDE